MPPRARSTASKQQPVDPNSSDNVVHPVDGNPSAKPGPLCPECFAAGWPASAEQSVGCAHGLWVRQWPAAVEPPPASDEGGE